MTEGTDPTTESGGTADESEGVEGVGTYETDDSVVFYDTENPLAWIQTPDALSIEEMA